MALRLEVHYAGIRTPSCLHAIEQISVTSASNLSLSLYVVEQGNVLPQDLSTIPPIMARYKPYCFGRAGSCVFCKQ
jgi:hypothetical protein